MSKVSSEGQSRGNRVHDETSIKLDTSDENQPQNCPKPPLPPQKVMTSSSGLQEICLLRS